MGLVCVRVLLYMVHMDKVTGQNYAGGYLYPANEPFDARMINVDDGHSVYVEQVGNPEGIPVVVLHGGPGGGCSPSMRRFFDPKRFRVVLFDQRGCGRSRPHAAIEANTTWHLVEDIETIRQSLGIDRWYCFGGSWGATLALIYAQTHPERALGLILRGVFLMTQPELDWFYGGGAGAFWPELWEKFIAPIPVDEHHDLIDAYHKRLFSGDVEAETRFARTWAQWENALASVESQGMVGETPGDYARAFARLENHYFKNGGFLDDTTAILNRMERLTDVPGHIVQGRFDMICPPTSSFRLHRAWPGSKLHMVHMAGHALSEPGISRTLVKIMDHIAETAQ